MTGTHGMSLACRGVGFAYDVAGAPEPALDDVSFAVPAGGAAALLGASGAGKTTLLNVVRGLDDPEAGGIELDGVAADSPEHAALERQVGLVFQHPELQLFASTARDDVAFGPRCLGWEAQAAQTAADEALDRVGLPADVFGDRHPYALSGGEQRRLALAGVLAMRPRLLLLDEPFVSLDPETRRDLALILAGLKADGITMVLATHDIDLAWTLCDDIVILDRGRVAAAGAWRPGEETAAMLAGNRLREPFLWDLWRRLGRDVASAPRTIPQAAEALA